MYPCNLRGGPGSAAGGLWPCINQPDTIFIMKRILVAHDGFEHSDSALRKAIELAEDMRACLLVITVVSDIEYEEADEPVRPQVLQDKLAEAREAMRRVGESLSRQNLECRTMVRHGEPADKIIEYSGRIKADMVVVGSRSRSAAAKFLLGSVSSKVLADSRCPVLVVKAD